MSKDTFQGVLIGVLAFALWMNWNSDGHSPSPPDDDDNKPDIVDGLDKQIVVNVKNAFTDLDADQRVRFRGVWEAASDWVENGVSISLGDLNKTLSHAQKIAGYQAGQQEDITTAVDDAWDKHGLQKHADLGDGETREKTVMVMDSIVEGVRQASE